MSQQFVTLIVWIGGLCVFLFTGVTQQQNVVANNRLLGQFRGQQTNGRNSPKKVLLPSYDVSVRRFTIRKHTDLVKVPLVGLSSQTTVSTSSTVTQPTTTTTTTTEGTTTHRRTTTIKPQASIDDDVTQGDCDCSSMKNEIEILQEESRKLNYRVSQLYVQFLQEILNKKDDTLRYKDLQNQLLNETVRHYQLREMHYELREMVLNMGNTLVEQRQLIRNLESQPPAALPRQTVRIVNKPTQNVAIPDGPVQNMPAPTTETTATTTSSTEQILGGPYEDCVGAQTDGQSRSGIYLMALPSGTNFKAWCDFDQDPGGWLVIQRRSGGRTNFHRNIAMYKKGFGSVDSDFWLGLDNIHFLTSQSGVNYKLHIDMEDWEGKSTYVEYMSFRVTGEDDGYRLKIAHYSGNAGDSLSWHNNMQFTTKNYDNDLFGKNCANYQKGGWWYKSCAHSNLNGIYYQQGYYKGEYQDGIYWTNWHGASYSLKTVCMKIRPTE